MRYLGYVFLPLLTYTSHLTFEEMRPTFLFSFFIITLFYDIDDDDDV